MKFIKISWNCEIICLFLFRSHILFSCLLHGGDGKLLREVCLGFLICICGLIDYWLVLKLDKDDPEERNQGHKARP